MTRREGGRSLRGFYLGLAIVAVLGIGFIAVQRFGSDTPRGTGTLEVAELGELGRRSLGSSEAPLTIVEFADFQCGACAEYARTQVPEIKAMVDEGLVHYVFVDFPLPSHPFAVPAATAGWCAAEQDAFWPYHDRLFAEHSTWAFSEDAAPHLLEYAAEAGLDAGEFEDCLSSERYSTQVEDSRAVGRRVGVRYTPSLVVNGRLLDDLPSAEALRRMALEADRGERPDGEDVTAAGQ